jgi:hypothetical protein
MFEDELIQEIPKPLSHWYGKTTIAEENAELLARKKVLRTLKTAPRWAWWAKDELKEASKALASLNKQLEADGINQALATLKELNQEAEEIHIQLFNTQQEYRRSQQPEQCEQLRKEGKTLLRNMEGVQKDRKALMERLRPYRAAIQKRDKIAARIQEHYAAIAEANEEAIRTRDMDKEARLIAERMILALNKLGFYHKKTKRDMFGKTVEIKEMCRFERIVNAVDQVQLKLDVTRLGLLGGHVDQLPYGVYAQDVVADRVLIHLSIALELPVTSPNNTGEADWNKGVWFLVERLGIPDGLETKVLYSTVMKRYPEAKRHLMPVPLGVRSGRKINWVFLANEPHIMINGTTGYGKSNSLQMLLATVVAKHSPDEVKLIIVDMKNSGDYRAFKDLPHVLAFISKLEKAHELMVSLWMEMERRKGIIGTISNDLNKYNELVAPEDRLPHIYFVFDEYPSIKIKRKIANEINSYASFIAMQGRSAGIHLIVSGQQSFAEDFPRTLTSNITLKLTAKQTSVSGAMGTVGTREPMRLKEIAGRFMVLRAKPFQIQMPYISDAEIAAAGDMARRWPEPKPFALPIVPKEEDDEISILPTKSPEELVLEAAFRQFEGALKADLIWKALDSKLSINKVRDTVKHLSSQESIEFDDKVFQPVKERKYYRLIELESEAEELEEAN